LDKEVIEIRRLINISLTLTHLETKRDFIKKISPKIYGKPLPVKNEIKRGVPKKEEP